MVSNLAFLTPTLSSDANNVYLNLERNTAAFPSVALTWNQYATASGIQTMPAWSPVVSAIVSMDANQARAAYDNLSGEIHASLKGAILDNASYVNNAINQHSMGTTVPDTGKGLWFSSWWHDGHFKRSSNTAKLDNQGGGFLLGFDAYSDETSRVGAAIGYERTKLDADARQSSADADAVHLMAYGATKAGVIDIRGNIGYTWLNIDSTRQISVPSLLSKNETMS